MSPTPNNHGSGSQPSNNSAASFPADIPGADEILQEVKGKHASPSVVKHGLFSFYFNRKSVRYMARQLGKSPSTVHRWIKRWEKDRLSGRLQKDPQFRKFGPDHRAWIKEYYENYPLTFIDEAVRAFEEHFEMTISHSHLWTILAEAGFTRKVVPSYHPSSATEPSNFAILFSHRSFQSLLTSLNSPSSSTYVEQVLEKRAREIRRDDVVRFIKELSDLNWSPSSLIFLDEVSFDSRDMRRRYGYSPRGQKLVVRGDTGRSQRISLLCFQGVNGLLEAYMTKGTFTRAIFFEKMRDFALSGVISPYPGPRSVWIMDGARIHCDPAIINYLRTLGIHVCCLNQLLTYSPLTFGLLHVQVIFLPAYCPFLNPIEFMFSAVKARMRRHYKEGAVPFSQLNRFVAAVLKDMCKMSMRGYFEACGYGVANCFDSSRGWSSDIIDVTCRGGGGFDETDVQDGDDNDCVDDE